MLANQMHTRYNNTACEKHDITKPHIPGYSVPVPLAVDGGDERNGGQNEKEKHKWQSYP